MKDEIYTKQNFLIAIILGLLVNSIFLILKKNILLSIAAFFSIVFLFFAYIKIKKSFKETGRIRKIESVFPDFLQLMSSNLRAGMTIDRALMLSSRPEFSPLDEEILKTAKDIATSKNIEASFLDLSKRIGSEKIKKTILLIIAGIKAGGDIAILLQETSTRLRERELIEKKAYTNVIMYVVFIFLIVSIFAPSLFSLSNILVEMLTKLLSGIPKVETSVTMPFTLSKINVSLEFIKYFSIFFIVVIDLLSSFVLGLITKGSEKEGLKYFPAIFILSIITFFGSRILLKRFLEGLI